MFFAVDPDNPKPLYEQLSDNIKAQIHSGKLSPGDKLPPVRVLAETLNINMHTVRHAYRLLADENIVRVRLGQSTTVNPLPSAAKPDRETADYLLQKWEELRREAFLRGVDAGQLWQLLQAKEESHA